MNKTTIIKGIYTPHFDQLAYNLGLKGLTNAEIAKELNISPNALYEWRNKYPSFKEALQKGKDTYDSEMVEKALLEDALGKEYTEVTEVTGKDGELIETKKAHKWQRNYQAQRMWLLNRNRDRWKDQTEVVVSAKELEEKLQEAEKRLTELREKYGKTSPSGDKRCDPLAEPERSEGGKPALPGPGTGE